MGQSIPSLAAVEFLLLPYVKELSVKQPAGLDYASTSQLEHPTDTWRKLTIVTIALAPGGTALVRAVAESVYTNVLLIKKPQ